MTSLNLPAAAVLLIVALVMTSSVGGSPMPLRQPRQQMRHPSLPPSSYNFRSTMQRMDAAHDWGTQHGRILNYEDSLNQLGLSSWGMDWSRKMLHHPEAVQPRHHVTSTSNSYPNLPSPTSVYTNLYKSSPTVMSSTYPLYYSSPMFSASRMPHPHPHDLVHQADRFELGPSSSTSNSDQLSEFSRTLNRLRTTQNMEPSIPLQDEDEESVMLTTEESPQEGGGTILVQSSVEFEVVEPNVVAQREDLPSDTDNRVRELSTSLTNVRFADGNLVEDGKLPDLAARQQQNLVTGSEISPTTIEESNGGESVTDEVESDRFVNKDNSDNFEHIFINDFFDVSQLIQENLIDLNNRELDTGNDTKYFDEGKSFSSQSNSPRKLIQIIADRESTVNEDSNHKTIFLTILKPQSRNKGTKLRGSSIAEIDSQTNNNDSQKLLTMPFHDLRQTPIPIVSRENNLNPNIDFQSDLDYEGDVVQEFEVIGKQIAAMNRIGDADISDYLEDVPAESRTQVDGIPVRTELSETISDSYANNNTLPHSNTTQQTLNKQVGIVTESLNDQDIKGKDQNTSKRNSTKISQGLQYQTEARWSPTAKNKYKQMIPGYQLPPGANLFKSDQYQESTGKFHSSGSYQAEDLSEQNYGSKVTGSQEPTIPYQQKYPGWAEVIPYQYHNKDPVTGAYSFGYGDQYQWRQEERRPDGVTFGGYGWLDETGKHHVTRFIADARGYRVLDPGQQIDFNVIPVYPATPSPEDYSFGSSSISYGENPTLDKEPFVTPRPLILEPVGLNIPYQQPPSSATSSASSQYPLPAGSSNRPPYLQFTVNTPPPQTVFGSTGQYSSLPTTRLPYSQTLTGTSRPYQQAPSKPNNISGTNLNSYNSALVGSGENLSSQSLGTIGSQISSLASGQNVGQNGPLSSSSFPVNPAIPPSVLNHLYQQVTNQYQQKPHHGVGGSTSLSGSYSGHTNLPLNPYSATVADINRNYQTAYPAKLIMSGSGISSADHGPGLPSVYGDPIIDVQPSSGNVIEVDEKESDKQKKGEKGNNFATGRPAISYPLPDTERETNMTGIDQMSLIDEVIPFGGRPTQYIPDSGAPDHRPWTSSVIRVQKPPRSPSLDYSFLTDDDLESVDDETPVQTYDDIRTFLFDLLQKENGVSSPIRNVDAEREKISSSDLSEKDGSGNTQLSSMDEKYNSEITLGKKEVSKGAEKLRSDKVDSNIDDVKKGNTGETVGDYLGTVKFRIPVLGALDGLQQYGDLQVTRNEPAKIANEKSEVEVIDYKKTRDDLEIEEDDDEESSSNNKSENKLKEVSSDNKPKSPRPSRPPPPPPLNFFTELLKQLMMARSDSNFNGQMPH